MSASEPQKQWWAADEIAGADLPEMPATKRRVNALAKKDGWQSREGYARRRAGRGGGWEYHWALFPDAAKKALIAAEMQDIPKGPEQRDEAWAWYDSLPGAAKAKAEARLRCLTMVEALHNAGDTVEYAVLEASTTHDVSARTIWNWRDLVVGIRRDDWLPHLAPRHSLKAPKPSLNKAEFSPEFWDYLKSDYLIYQLGPSERHRPHHESKNGLTLPVDDPFWDRWYPQNGWGCKCWVRQITRAEADTRGVDASPPIETRPVENPRTGEISDVPVGIDHGWDRNPGALRLRAVEDLLSEKLNAAPPAIAAAARHDIANSWLAKRSAQDQSPSSAPEL